MFKKFATMQHDRVICDFYTYLKQKLRNKDSTLKYSLNPKKKYFDSATKHFNVFYRPDWTEMRWNTVSMLEINKKLDSKVLFLKMKAAQLEMALKRKCIIKVFYPHQSSNCCLRL